MARTAPIGGASSCSTEMATSMHIPFGKSVLHVLQQHIQDGIALVSRLLGTQVRTRVKVTVCFSACPCKAKDPCLRTPMRDYYINTYKYVYINISRGKHNSGRRHIFKLKYSVGTQTWCRLDKTEVGNFQR